MRVLLLVLLVLAGCSHPSFEGYLCNPAICNNIYIELIRGAESSVDCAFYSLNSEAIISALDEAPARVVMHNKPIKRSYVRGAKTYGLMHNKFCVIDRKVVVTGSYNPYDGARTEANNIVVIRGERIARLYQAEFDELWSGVFGGGQPSPLQFGQNRVYFCPEDDCARRVIDEIRKAKQEIRFAHYSFTSGEIGLALVEAKKRGIRVSGVFEGSQRSNYSQYGLLCFQGVDVRVENTSLLLHQKLMLIDNTTVLTGSFNPTKNAQLRNDENLAIIRDGPLTSLLGSGLSSLCGKPSSCIHMRC